MSKSKVFVKIEFMDKNEIFRVVWLRDNYWFKTLTFDCRRQLTVKLWPWYRWPSKTSYIRLGNTTNTAARKRNNVADAVKLINCFSEMSVLQHFFLKGLDNTWIFFTRILLSLKSQLPYSICTYPKKYLTSP